MTTNLTQRRPHRVPFDDRTYHYCASCLADYFPQSVVDQCDRTAPESVAYVDSNVGGRRVRIDMRCPRHLDCVVRHLPSAPDLPVVLAARLSLSFPGLISAVPLAYIDFARARSTFASS